MRTYILQVTAREIVDLLRREIAEEHDQPELYHSAWEDFIIEENFDRRAYGIRDGREYDLVSKEAVLNIEPRIERDYWVLKIVVHQELGPRTVAEENAMLGTELTLDAFDAGFLAKGSGMVQVRLETETPEARKHFDRWLAEMRARHPGSTRDPHRTHDAGSTA